MASGLSPHRRAGTVDCLLQCSLPFFHFWVLGDVPGAEAALSPCPGPSTVRYGHARPCCCWCWRPGALSSCHAVAFSISVASFGLSCVHGFYTMELKCILLLGSLHCPCSPSASSHTPSVHLPDSLKPLLPLFPLESDCPQQPPWPLLTPCPALPAGFYKNTTNLLVFIYKHSFIGLLPCVVRLFFSPSLLRPPAFCSKARSQQDERSLCQLSFPGMPRAAAG